MKKEVKKLKDEKKESDALADAFGKRVKELETALEKSNLESLEM